MNTKIAVAIVILGIVGLSYFIFTHGWRNTNTPIDATPQNMVLSGTYVCLPHLDTTGPQTQECAFGILTDEGDYYAVNFGQSADAMEQFQSGAHITAEGFVVVKEALSSDHWTKYNMKGVFTITGMIGPSTSSGKLNIDVVCESALAYMSFPDGESAAKFVAECKAGEHPEVIERYKADLNLGEGVAI